MTGRTRLNSRKFSTVLTVATLTLAAGATNAHHSAAAVFTDEDIVIEGTVTRYVFKNPHVSIYVNVVDENGAEQQWMATGPATPSLHKQGWTRGTFEKGQYLRISGKKGRNERPMVLMMGGEISSGRAITEIDPADGSVIRVVSRESLSVAKSSASREKPPLLLPDGRPNFSGTWFGGLKAAITDQTAPPLNDKGRALQAGFDPIEDPEFASCENQPGLVRQTISFLPWRVSQHDDHVLIEYEGYGTRRVIQLDGQRADTDAHSAMGQYVARYEDDTLVVETTQLLGKLTSVGGNALSDQTTTVERFRRVDTAETAKLEMSVEVTDPGHLTEPWTIIVHMSYDPDYVFAGTDCQLPLLGQGERAAQE